MNEIGYYPQMVADELASITGGSVKKYNSRKEVFAFIDKYIQDNEQLLKKGTCLFTGPSNHIFSNTSNTLAQR